MKAVTVRRRDYFIREVYQGREWAYRSYDPCSQGYRYYEKSEHCSGEGGRGEGAAPGSAREAGGS